VSKWRKATQCIKGGRLGKNLGLDATGKRVNEGDGGSELQKPRRTKGKLKNKKKVLSCWEELQSQINDYILHSLFRRVDRFIERGVVPEKEGKKNEQKVGSEENGFFSKVVMGKKEVGKKIRKRRTINKIPAKKNRCANASE